MNMMNAHKIILGLALASTLLLWLACFFQWELAELLVIFFAPLGWFAIWMIVGISAIASLAHALKARSLVDLVPLSINVVAIAVTFLVPWTEAFVWANFNCNFGARQKVIADIESGKLRPNVSYNSSVIALPLRSAYLSSGGDVITGPISQRTATESPSERYVLFFAFRGILSHYSGFVYCTDDSEPPDEGRRYELRKLRDHWFWVAY